MVQLRDRRILIDGKPVLLFAGEVHYYRLKRGDWEDRVRKAKALGCTAIASYIPWIVHEPQEGDIDVTGRRRPEHDIGAFIDLCHRHGLWFIPRPGPFVMAEMKNEGIPYWVYRRHPDAIPISWEGKPGTTKTLNFLDPGYLESAARWYAAIMPLVAARLQTKGGPVIGVQLDNEIGMLQWVSNNPDLSEQALCQFSQWLTMRYSSEQLSARYPFDLNDPAPRIQAIRNPKDTYAAALHRDLGDFEKHRIAEYVATLRHMAESHGVRDVPFIVNIHGSGGGRGTMFPIGIHQLYEAYTQAEGYLSGSDHYLGELRRENVQDLYYINAFMAATHRPEQPLTSMEFEVGTGDYGETGGVRMSGAAADFKARLSIAQGNRLLNYYVLSGGTNPPLETPVGDGNDRVAFTGQRHGFAAPISPEGRLDATYHSLAATTAALAAVGDRLADMDEEHDAISLAFLPDYYKTDFHRPGPMREIVSGLEAIRGNLETLTRTLLFLGYRYPAVDVQNRPLDPARTPAIAMATARYMDEPVQRKLGDYVRSGGRLFLYGEFPVMDMEGKPCLTLAGALGVKPLPPVEASGDYHLSVVGEGIARTEPEVRIWRGTPFEAPNAKVFLRILDKKVPVGLVADVGRGRAAILACNYPYHPDLYHAVLTALGLAPAISEGISHDGVVVTTVANAKGERFMTILNLDAEAKTFRFKEGGRPMFGGRPLGIGGFEARLLPLGVVLGKAKVEFATTDIAEVGEGHLSFRRTRDTEYAAIRSGGGTRTVEIPAGRGAYRVEL
ncbi:MAG: beta-galactosidase [Fimbriimonas sp.]